MLEELIQSFVTLFVTANPLSVVPLFVIVTTGMSAGERHQVALRSVATATIILVSFALLGESIIHFFGITIEAFEIAGGLLLFATAFHMVFSSDKPSVMHAAVEDRDTDMTRVAVFPLAIPMMSGPGAISATILLTSLGESWLDAVALVGVILALMALSYVVLLMSDRIDRALGNVGRIVVSRLLGVILAALAIQFVGTGVRSFVERIAAGS